MLCAIFIPICKIQVGFLVMGRKNLNDILDILPVVLTVIIGTFVFAIASHLVIEERFPDKLLDLWNTWDVQHYIKIAKYGYGALTVDGRNPFRSYSSLYSRSLSSCSHIFSRIT